MIIATYFFFKARVKTPQVCIEKIIKPFIDIVIPKYIIPLLSTLMKLKFGCGVFVAVSEVRRFNVINW